MVNHIFCIEMVDGFLSIYVSCDKYDFIFLSKVFYDHCQRSHCRSQLFWGLIHSDLRHWPFIWEHSCTQSWHAPCISCGISTSWSKSVQDAYSSILVTLQTTKRIMLGVFWSLHLWPWACPVRVISFQSVILCVVLQWYVYSLVAFFFLCLYCIVGSFKQYCGSFENVFYPCCSTTDLYYPERILEARD